MFKKRFPDTDVESLPPVRRADIAMAAGQIASEFLRTDKRTIYEVFSEWYVEQGLRAIQAPFLERYHDPFNREGNGTTLNMGDFKELVHLSDGGDKPAFVASADIWENTLTAWRTLGQRTHRTGHTELILEPIVSQTLGSDGSFELPRWDLPRQATLVLRENQMWFGQEYEIPQALVPFSELAQEITSRLQPQRDISGTSSVA